jgi:hypothetical protein
MVAQALGARRLSPHIWKRFQMMCGAQYNNRSSN